MVRFVLQVALAETPIAGNAAPERSSTCITGLSGAVNTGGVCGSSNLSNGTRQNSSRSSSSSNACSLSPPRPRTRTVSERDNEGIRSPNASSTRTRFPDRWLIKPLSHSNAYALRTLQLWLATRRVSALSIEAQTSSEPHFLIRGRALSRSTAVLAPTRP